jgi:hypothetical protein
MKELPQLQMRASLFQAILIWPVFHLKRQFTRYMFYESKCELFRFTEHSPCSELMVLENLNGLFLSYVNLVQDFN